MAVSMTASSIEQLTDRHLQVKGELGFDNAVFLKIQGERLISMAADQIEIDFSQVTRAGSAALTLLCGWLRYAAELQKNIIFTHLPADLIGVARVSGVDQILPIK